MNRSSPSPKKMIESLRKIRRSGKDDSTAAAFLKDICGGPDPEIIDWANHCLAVAELMSRLAPKKQRDAWYTAGLLYRLPDLKEAEYGKKQSRVVTAAILKKAKYPLDMIRSIEISADTDDPRAWPLLTASLVFADLHVTKEGDIQTSEGCCLLREESPQERCTACMYARYYLAKEDKLEEYERKTDELRKELAAITEANRAHNE